MCHDIVLTSFVCRGEVYICMRCRTHAVGSVRQLTSSAAADIEQSWPALRLLLFELYVHMTDVCRSVSPV